MLSAVEKRELRKHFSASACSFLGLGLKNQVLASKNLSSVPFFYFGNLEKLKSDEDKFFLRVASTIIKTKYYF